MRIVHVLTRFARGGTEGNVLHTMAWERAQGHEVSLVVGGESDRQVVENLDPVPEVEVISALRRAVHPVQDARALLELRRVFRRLAPDVIHTHQSKAGVLGRSAGGTTAVLVHTIHMMSFGPKYGAQSRLLVAAERICAWRTDVMVSVGEQLVRDYLRAGIGRPDQYLVVRSPVDVERFLDARVERQMLRTEVRECAGLPEHAPLLITAGALEGRKRHARLIHELAPLLRDGLLLLVAGDGPLRSELQSVVDEHGISSSVRFLGHVSDLERWLAASDLYVHAADTEGVPQVVLQALATGLPVVAIDTDGLREIDGAPVTLVPDASGALRDVVERAEWRHSVPLDPSALDPWRRPSLAEQLAALHLRIQRAQPASV